MYRQFIPLRACAAHSWINQRMPIIDLVWSPAFSRMMRCACEMIESTFYRRLAGIRFVQRTTPPFSILHAPYVRRTPRLPPANVPHRPSHRPGLLHAHIREARWFNLDLAPPARQPLAVVCGGVEHLDPAYSVDRATFPYFSIEFVARGQGKLVLSGETIRLLPVKASVYAPACRIRSPPTVTIRSSNISSILPAAVRVHCCGSSASAGH